MAKRGRDSIAFREVEGKDGPTLYARFWVEEKTADGSFAARRIERSTGTCEPKKAQRVAERLRDEERRRALVEKPADIEHDKPIPVFAEAALKYLKNGGDGRFLSPILRSVGHEPMYRRVRNDDGFKLVSSFNQARVEQLAGDLYPGRTAATINRQVFTPIMAVVRHFDPDLAPMFKRPSGWLPPSNFDRHPSDWWQRVLPQCAPNLAAILLFWRIHGRRQTEATSIEPSHINRKTWRIDVSDTKVGQKITFTLAEPVIQQLELYPWWAQNRVFGYAHRWSVYKPLRKACDKANIPYHVPKDIGRHMMATHMLEERRTLKEVMEAGRWKTLRVPAMIYGHLEHNRVDDDARALGESWFEVVGKKGKVVGLKTGSKLGEDDAV